MTPGPPLWFTCLMITDALFVGAFLWNKDWAHPFYYVLLVLGALATVVQVWKAHRD